MLMREVNLFLKETGMPPTRFGREAAGDPRFVFDLRKGRSVGERLSARVRDYMGAAQ